VHVLIEEREEGDEHRLLGGLLITLSGSVLKTPSLEHLHFLKDVNELGQVFERVAFWLF